MTPQAINDILTCLPYRGTYAFRAIVFSVLLTGFITQDVLAAVSTSNESAAQDTSDTSEPFDFYLTFDIAESGNSNQFIKGAKLSVDGSVINYCFDTSTSYSSATTNSTTVPNGNFKNSSTVVLNSLDTGYAGLFDGTYTIGFEVWYDSSQRTADACTGYASISGSTSITVVGNQGPFATDQSGCSAAGRGKYRPI